MPHSDTGSGAPPTQPRFRYIPPPLTRNITLAARHRTPPSPTYFLTYKYHSFLPGGPCHCAGAASLDPQNTELAPSGLLRTHIFLFLRILLSLIPSLITLLILHCTTSPFLPSRTVLFPHSLPSPYSLRFNRHILYCTPPFIILFHNHFWGVVPRYHC